MRLVLAKRLAANASLALLLSLAFAGVTQSSTTAEAAPTAAEACPANFSLATYNSILYCERTVTGASLLSVTLPSGIDEIFVTVAGGRGGNGGGHSGPTTRNDLGGAGGSGDVLSGRISVSPGALVELAGANSGGSGGRGYAGQNVGGGGGGATGLAGYSGGTGGGASSDQYVYGASGGGGGGAGTLRINSSLIAVAGGGGGGGGGDDTNGYPGTSGSPRVGQTTGGNGTSVHDFGGGGGGGGGYPAGNGGASGKAGRGGHKGTSLVPAGLILSEATNSGAGYVYVRFLAVPRPVKISRTSPLATISNSITYSFEVEFSEAVTGFDAADVAVIGTSATGQNWSIEVQATASPKKFLVTVSNPQAPSGTIGVSVYGAGVQADDRVGVSTLSSALAQVDRTSPSVVSSSFLPTINPGRMEVVVTFSEPISSSATIDWSAFTFTGTSLNWSTLSPVVSGNTLTFVVSSSSLVDDTTLEYSIGLGFVQDHYGNELVAAYQDDLLIDLDAVAATFSNEPTRFSTSATIDLNFDAYVHGLTAADFSIVGDSVGCDITGVSGSGASYQVTVGTCTASTSGTIQVALAGNAALSLLGAPSPENQVLSSTFVYDNINPVAGVVSKTISGTRATYVISFSETVLGFSTNSISVSHSVAGGASGWSISNLVYLGNNEYSFDVENDAALNGNLSFTFRSGVTDIAGNALVSTSVASGSSVQILELPYFDPGPNSEIGKSGSKIAPSFDLNSRGSYIYGVRVELTNAQAGDTLLFTNQNSITKGAGSTNTVLYLAASTNIADSTWETALQSILFSTSSTVTSSRSIEYHVKPQKGYDYASGHFFQYKAAASITVANASTSAAALSLFGLQGYLATPTDASQNAALVASGVGTAWLGLGAVGSYADRSKILVGPGAGTTVIYAPTFGNQGDSRVIAGDSTIYINTYANGTWNDLGAGDNGAMTGYAVEYGGSPGDPELLVRKTQTHNIDSIGPFITRVYATDGDYKRGEEVELNVLFSEAVVVSGNSTTESKLEIMPGVFAEYVSGSGTSVLKYRYIVGAGVTTSDLSYVATNSLTAGSRAFKDMVGNTADLTLPAPGTSGSLISQSNVELSGDVLDIEMNTPLTQSSQANIQYVITSPVTMSCNTLAASDFTFQNLNSASFQVSPAGNSTSCTITLPHTISKGSFGFANLGLSNAFEITTDGGVTYSTIALIGNSVLVTNPADAGKGEVILDDSNLGRSRPQALTRNDSAGLLRGATADAIAAMKSRNVLAPPAGSTLPELEIRGDFRQLSNMSEVIAARKQQVIRAGDAVRAKMQIPAAEAANYKVLSYMDVNSGFLYTGEQDFDSNGEVVSDPLVFTEPGEYYVRMYVVAKTKVSGSDYPIAPQSLVRNRISPVFFQFFSFIAVRNAAPTYISQAQLEAIDSSQELELILIIEDGDTVAVQGSSPSAGNAGPSGAVSNPPSQPAKPVATAAPKPTVKVTPTPSATPTLTPSPTPSPTPTPTPTPSPSVTEAAEDPGQEPGVFEGAAEVLSDTVETVAQVFGISIPTVGEPVANPAIGASGDDSVIVEFDPLGTPEAVKATNNLLAATGALIGVAAAAGAAAAAAAAAGAASAASSAASAAGSAAGSANASATMNEDALDALAGAEYEIDVFEDEKAQWGDRLAIFALPIIRFLDTPTRIWTRRVARFSPFVSKLLNDGIYLRAIFGSVSILPTLLGLGLAVAALIQNDGVLIHPPIVLFIAITVLGIFDAFAGSLTVLLFLIGSLPLVRASELTDWRMLAGIVVAGFGPIILARSIRNFRRKAPRNLAGWLDRLGDLAFASLMGGWVAGLIVRALPALTGLTLPAANYVATFQFVATIAIALRILVEELAARYYPARMDALAPDWLPEPPKAQVVLVQILRYFFYVFIASAFMGFGILVWIAAALFMLPTFAGYFTEKLPRLPWLTRWMPIGLPGLAMILGLEIYLENTLSGILGDHPDFSIIFVYSLLLLILFISLLGLLARPEENEDHWLKNAKYRWIYRLGGLVTLVLLMQFTSML